MAIDNIVRSAKIRAKLRIYSYGGFKGLSEDKKEIVVDVVSR